MPRIIWMCLPQHEVGLFLDETLNPQLLKKHFPKKISKDSFSSSQNPYSFCSLISMLEVDLVLPSDMAVGTLQRAPL